VVGFCDPFIAGGSGCLPLATSRAMEAGGKFRGHWREFF